MHTSPLSALGRCFGLRQAATALALAAGLLQPAAPALAKPYTVIGDGWVTDLSADGRTATGQLSADFQTFRWRAEDGQVPLGRATTAIGLYSGTPAISADGEVIASSILDDSGQFGIQGRWTAATGWQVLWPLPRDAGQMDLDQAGVYGMSGNGKVVTGLYWRAGKKDGLAHGSAWTARKGVKDQGSGGRSSRIDDANHDGRVMVGWDEHLEWGMRQAAVWIHGQRQLLELSDWPSEAAAVDAAGTRIVGQAWDASTGVESAVMWTADGSGAWQRQLLGVLPGTEWDGSAYALGLSDDGQVVVGFGRTTFSPQSSGWVWTPATGLMEARAFLSAQGIDLPRRYQVFEVSAVSGDGRTLALATLDRQIPGSYRALLVRLPRPAAR
ncbi:hypothetical protein KAK07_18305 [Ideonella sp. 4Y16]|uniref:hypothetical protein n=1 Tax=Ideonella alba TaxID=2824118 RepID=UPI001B369502|nr:hypothetical protein [Ideonella alba]MBQ0945297.1 hypothetical protein [Ideonella alba]